MHRDDENDDSEERRMETGIYNYNYLDFHDGSSTQYLTLTDIPFPNRFRQRYNVFPLGGAERKIVMIGVMALNPQILGNLTYNLNI